MSDARPELTRDRSYWSLLVTQFLGAFNDNFYKQFVLLLCIDFKTAQNLTSDPYQSKAMAVFALPFVLFSLYTGAVADRYSKRTIAVLCKVLEIVVMGAATLVFVSFAKGSPALLWAAIGVIGLMSLQSTLFSPAKYGIIPELFRREDLPRVNAGVQMTTFVAIVLGMAIAGFVKDNLDGRLWVAGAIAVSIAVAGTITSLFIRPTPVAMPNTPFAAKSFIGDPAIWKNVFTTRSLRRAVLTYSLFFFLGAVVQSVINAFGKEQLLLSDTRTSLLAMSLSLGMGVGCFAAGLLSRMQNRPDLVVKGSLGLLAAGFLVTGISLLSLSQTLTFWLEMVAIAFFGAMAGTIAVPLQVVIQDTPPADQKGRTLGVNNFCTWVGILLGAGFYFVLSALFTKTIGQGDAIETTSHIGNAFALVGCLMLPAAWAYRKERKPTPVVA